MNKISTSNDIELQGLQKKRQKEIHKKEEEDCCNNCKLCTCAILCLLGIFYLVSFIVILIWVFYVDDKD